MKEVLTDREILMDFRNETNRKLITIFWVAWLTLAISISIIFALFLRWGIGLK